MRSVRPLVCAAAVAYMVIVLWLNAAVVHRLNLNAGGWVLLLGLLNAALLLGSLNRIDRRRVTLHLFLLVATAGVFAYVNARSDWKATCEVRTAKDVFTFENDTRYFTAELEPSRLPFAAVNDVWAILDTSNTTCTITWAGPTDTLSTSTSFSALFKLRSAVPATYHPRSSAWLLIALLILFGISAFVENASNYFRDVELSWEYLRTRRAAVLFFAIGALVGSMKLLPADWLTNEFLSRPDDWLCYEKGARQILSGNVLLLPSPGGVEMWSPLFTYLVAALHFLFGPALGVLHVIKHGAHYLVLWGVIALLTTTNRWLWVAILLGGLLFVEVDLNRHYAWRLLSDTLPLVMLPAILIAWKRGSPLWVLGLMCGALYLLRLELLGIGPLLLAVMYLSDRSRLTRNAVGGFTLAFLVCVVPYLLRRYAMFHDILPLPLGMGESGHLHWRTLLSWDFLVLKATALFGHYDLLNTDLRFRYHWLVVHGLFVVAIIAAIRKQRSDRYITFALLAWSYVFATRMASPSIGIYGHRHSLLLILLEMITIVLVAERYVGQWTPTRLARRSA